MTISEQNMIVPSKSIRFASMLIDHLAMSFIAVIFSTPFMLIDIPLGTSVPDVVQEILKYISIIGFALYFCKDCLQGRSIAKRILKHQVISVKTGEIASPLQCLLRNSTCVLWPLEIIMVLINSQRRLGDYIAGTQVVPYNSTIHTGKIEYGKTILSFFIAYGVVATAYFYYTPSRNFGSIGDFSSLNYTYISDSYNSEESTRIEKQLSDSLGNDYTAHVKVYDKVKEVPKKYIIFTISTEKALKDTTMFSDAIIDNALNNILRQHYTPNTFVGKIEFSYKYNNTMKSNTYYLTNKE